MPPRSVRHHRTIAERQVEDICISVYIRPLETRHERLPRRIVRGRRGRRCVYSTSTAACIRCHRRRNIGPSLATSPHTSHIRRSVSSVIPSHSLPTFVPNTRSTLPYPHAQGRPGRRERHIRKRSSGLKLCDLRLFPCLIVQRANSLLSPAHEGPSHYEHISKSFKIEIVKTHSPPPPPPADHHVLAPKNILVICPSVDMRHVNPSPESLIAQKDSILSQKLLERPARTYVGHWSLDDPRVSPLLADMEPLARYGVQVHGCTAG